MKNPLPVWKTQILAFCACVMMVAFYIIGLAVSGFALWLFFHTDVHDMPLSLIPLMFMGDSMALLMPLVPFRNIGKHQQMGALLARGDQPEIWERVRAVARQLNRKMPSGIILNEDFSVDCVRIGGFFGIGGKDLLVIGLPIVCYVTASELDALVAQALLRRHVRITLWYLSHCPNMELSSRMYDFPSPCQDFAGWQLARIRSLLWRVHNADQERADQKAARLAGSAVLASALTKTTRIEEVMCRYFCLEVHHARDCGFLLPIVESLVAMQSLPAIVDEMDRHLQEAIEQTEPEPGNFHVLLATRIRQFGGVPSMLASDSRPALELLRNTEGLEQDIVLRQPRWPRKKKTLKRVGPDETGRIAKIAVWQSFVLDRAEEFAHLCVKDIPRLAADPEYFGFVFLATQGPMRPIRPDMTQAQIQFHLQYILGAALACRLYACGWIPSCEPVSTVLQRGEQYFDPFNSIYDLTTKRITVEEWDGRIDEAGIFRTMSLAHIPRQDVPDPTQPLPDQRPV